MKRKIILKRKKLNREKEYQQLITDIGKIVLKGRREIREILKSNEY